jgi:hypothetical protein
MTDTELYATALKTGLQMERARILTLMRVQTKKLNITGQLDAAKAIDDLIELIKEGTN